MVTAVTPSGATPFSAGSHTALQALNMGVLQALRYLHSREALLLVR